MICALESESEIIFEQQGLKAHVMDFYKQLLGSAGHPAAQLSSSVCPTEEQLDEEDMIRLSEPFYEKEVVVAIEGIKTESAPGPNGFTVIFFKKLWQHIKHEIMGMVRNFNEAKLDLQRLNYGVITLVPKVKEAKLIKQYRPICLLNVDFKIFPKLLIDRLTPMAGKLISPNQTALLKGETYWKGWLFSMRCCMSLRSLENRGSALKLILKSPMIRLNGSLCMMS
jgi:hypothetical protein